MRLYYIFLINEKAYRKHLQNEYVLYCEFKKIYSSRLLKEYKIEKFFDICDLFEKNRLIDYLECKYKNYISRKNNIFLYEDHLIKILHPCIKIKTNNNIERFMFDLTTYSENIFVCDFENEDYFWLNKIYNIKKTFEYI
ncbi:MAG TPA: sporulation inhibitor of replication protein SirA [Tenericutes bacterium]|nr:sporulation inhibitor of replication protein SirA [Mycoplasmatota bacterium]